MFDSSRVSLTLVADEHFSNVVSRIPQSIYLQLYPSQDAAQLADEARELQLYQHRQAIRDARHSVVNSVLQYMGMGGVQVPVVVGEQKGDGEGE